MGPALCMAHWEPHFQASTGGPQQALQDHMGFGQEATDPGNKARRTVPRQNREAPRRQRGLPGTALPTAFALWVVLWMVAVRQLAAGPIPINKCLRVA